MAIKADNSGAVKPVEYRLRLTDKLLDELLPQLSAFLVVGPRAAGKTTTLGRRAKTIIRLDREREAAAFEADPDAALRGSPEPVLLDEWQVVPGTLGAVRRAVEQAPRPGRFFVTGSVRAELENELWPATGRLVRVALYPMTIREQLGGLGEATFFDKLAGGEQLAVPADSPDLRGYVELALRSGFPTPALMLTGRARQVWLESYLEDLLTHDIEQIEETRTRGRDTQRLRRYFEAYALNSAGVLDHKPIYDAAGVNKATASAYEQLLMNLLIAEQVPAWTSNRLKRLVHQPKRYLVDAALLAAALRVDEQGVLRDGNLLGRILETFVAAQLRPEVALSTSRPRLYHLRTKQGRQEVDLVAELAGQRLIGIEVKADASPGKQAARHLVWLRDKFGDRFVRGVVFHTGSRLYRLEDKVLAAPMAALWAS
jgi:predicted AAA+ superfamily ATPase